jgi:hypothetical protein
MEKVSIISSSDIRKRLSWQVDPMRASNWNRYISYGFGLSVAYWKYNLVKKMYNHNLAILLDRCIKFRFKFITLHVYVKSRDSSVGIALGYGLNDRDSRVRFPAGAGNFSLHHRLHPASYPMGTRGSFPGGKAAGVWSWPLTSI